jgi:hypothetical protein
MTFCDNNTKAVVLKCVTVREEMVKTIIYGHPLFLFIFLTLCLPTGYGNNAVEMETTATYDKATQEFIVNTPTPLAQKYWITNGAVHAKHIIVFAQVSI